MRNQPLSKAHTPMHPRNMPCSRGREDRPQLDRRRMFRLRGSRKLGGWHSMPQPSLATTKCRNYLLAAGEALPLMPSCTHFQRIGTGHDGRECARLRRTLPRVCNTAKTHERCNGRRGSRAHRNQSFGSRR